MRAFWLKIVDDDLPTLAAALAYYSALSVAPLAVVTVVILSYLPASVSDLTQQVQILFGQPAAEMAKNLLEQSANPSTRSWAGAFSIGVSLIFASAMFAQLQSSLNRIFQVKARPVRVWFLKRLQSVGLVFVLILSLFLGSIVLVVLKKLPNNLVPISLDDSFRLISLGLSAVLALKFLPEKKVAWAAALVAGILTGVLFEVGARLFGFYLQATAISSAYGATGTLLVFLLWIFYSALILLFGAEICYFINHRKR